MSDKPAMNIDFRDSALTLENLEQILKILNEEGCVNILGVQIGSVSLMKMAIDMYVLGQSVTETGKR